MVSFCVLWDGGVISGGGRTGQGLVEPPDRI